MVPVEERLVTDANNLLSIDIAGDGKDASADAVRYIKRNVRYDDFANTVRRILPPAGNEDRRSLRIGRANILECVCGNIGDVVEMIFNAKN